MTTPPRIPPRQVPVLTEVIEVLDLRDDLDSDPQDLQVAAVVTPAAPLFEPTHAQAAPPAPAASHYVSHPQAAPADVPPALSALLEQPPVFLEQDGGWAPQGGAGSGGPLAHLGQVEYLGQIGNVAEPHLQAPAIDGAGVLQQSAQPPQAADPDDAAPSWTPAPFEPQAVQPPPAEAAVQPVPPDDATPQATAEVPQEQPLQTDDQLTQRVLHEVQRHIDLMLEYRLRQVLGPILARAADGIVKDARQDLAATLRDVVARAVAQEIARQRGR